MADEYSFDGRDESFDLLGSGDDFLDMLQMSESMNPFELPSEDMLFNLDQWIEEQAPLALKEDYTQIEISSNQNLDVAIAYAQVSEPGSETDLSGSSSVSSSNSSSLSPIPPNNPSVTPPKKTQKRRFEDYLSEFLGTQPVDTATKRQKYSTEGRKKVWQVRKAGACIPCKLLKTPVSLFDNV
jgi:hypothetical protein